MTVNILTLGCSKNLVDSEHLLSQFRAGGYQVMHDRYDTPADIVIINTCGFILDAREESIETILAFIDEKKKGRLRKLFVMGCLSEQYAEELAGELPEVDGFFGVWDMPAVLRAAGTSLDQRLLTDRVVTTPSHYSYLKVSEGCNRTCAFCAIPAIRGVQRSLPVEVLVNEAENLARKGVKELILIAQDLTAYGTDLYGKRMLPGLLRELLKLEGIEWFRLHYAYPAGFPEELIELIATEEKICNYLDIPIQHIDDGLLKAMQRGHDRDSLEKLFRKIRSQIPDVALRTTVITGFPGETENSFRELVSFLKEFRFERLGVFPYSHEEGTHAHRSMNDRVPLSVKKKRAAVIMQLQQEISLGINQSRIGQTMRVLIDREEGDYFVGRTRYDSPEVDNEVLVTTEDRLFPGEFYDVEITGAAEFDLYGKPLSL